MDVAREVGEYGSGMLRLKVESFPKRSKQDQFGNLVEVLIRMGGHRDGDVHG